MEDIKHKLTGNALRDYTLVKAALDGDDSAFTRLLAQYKDAIYFMMLKMVNNRTDAEDLTLEAFGKAFKSLHRYSPKYAFSTWLFTIASNNCIDFLRKTKQPTVPLENEQNENNHAYKLKTRDPNPEERMIKKQKAVFLRDVVGKLTPRYQALVEYRYFREYTYEELARELDIPMGTVKAQLFRARQLLFKLIETSDVNNQD